MHEGILNFFLFTSLSIYPRFHLPLFNFPPAFHTQNIMLIILLLAHQTHPLITRQTHLNLLLWGDVVDVLAVVSMRATLLSHGLCVRLMRNPLGGGSWGSLLHHAINLLERKTLGLRNQEVGVHESAGTETSPNEEDGGLEVTLVFSNHVWCDNSDDCVPEPVGGGGETDTTGSDWEREDLTDENPSSWTPG